MGGGGKEKGRLRRVVAIELEEGRGRRGCVRGKAIEVGVDERGGLARVVGGGMVRVIWLRWVSGEVLCHWDGGKRVSRREGGQA